MESRSVFMTCVLCPRGCRIEIIKKGRNYEVRGNECARGVQYAINELTNPTRTLTSTVKTVFRDFPRLPVRTSGEIPLKDIFLFMSEVNKAVVERRLKPGERVMENILTTGIHLVATDDMTSVVPKEC